MVGTGELLDSHELFFTKDRKRKKGKHAKSSPKNGAVWNLRRDIKFKQAGVMFSALKVEKNEK